MISLPSSNTLLPQVRPQASGNNLYVMPSESTELVKLDLLHEAGSAYQPQPLCAAAANSLFTLASGRMDALQVSEFMDYRGIIVEHSQDVFSCQTTFYFLRRHFDELLPVVEQLLHDPAFPQDDFDAWCRKRKQTMQDRLLKSTEVARRLFYQTLFGTTHPLGCYADPQDADRLDRDVVMQYYHSRFMLRDIVVAGNVDNRMIDTLTALESNTDLESRRRLVTPDTVPSDRHIALTVPRATQTTLRIGRVLPLAWDDLDYARLMILVTMLGGHFGSRLMSNLREDKGYTYGITARTQLYRGVIVFYITTDVATGTADAAEKEIRHELQRLAEEPVDESELQLTKNVLAGDFIRSVDGILERSERFCRMLATGVSEQLTENLREALATTTPTHLMSLAQRWLNPDDMIYCRAGA